MRTFFAAVSQLIGSFRLDYEYEIEYDTIFDFQISDVSRALVLPVEFRQRGVVHGMKWVCVVIM